MVYCVYSLESPRWGDSNEYTQYTFILKKIEKTSLLYHLTWRIINPQSQWLELPLSRTIFHSPKGVRAIEVRLYFSDKVFLLQKVCRLSMTEKTLTNSWQTECHFSHKIYNISTSSYKYMFKTKISACYLSNIIISHRLFFSLHRFGNDMLIYYANIVKYVDISLTV